MFRGILRSRQPTAKKLRSIWCRVASRRRAQITAASRRERHAEVDFNHQMGEATPKNLFSKRVQRQSRFHAALREKEARKKAFGVTGQLRTKLHYDDSSPTDSVSLQTPKEKVAIKQVLHVLSVKKAPEPRNIFPKRALVTFKRKGASHAEQSVEDVYDHLLSDPSDREDSEEGLVDATKIEMSSPVAIQNELPRPCCKYKTRHVNWRHYKAIARHCYFRRELPSLAKDLPSHVDTVVPVVRALRNQWRNLTTAQKEYYVPNQAYLSRLSSSRRHRRQLLRIGCPVHLFQVLAGVDDCYLLKPGTSFDPLQPKVRYRRYVRTPFQAFVHLNVDAMISRVRNIQPAISTRKCSSYYVMSAAIAALSKHWDQMNVNEKRHYGSVATSMASEAEIEFDKLFEEANENSLPKLFGSHESHGTPKRKPAAVSPIVQRKKSTARA